MRFILEMVILKIPGQDPDFEVKISSPTVLNKQIPVIFREAISHFGRCVLLNHSSSSILPGTLLPSRQELSLADLLNVVDAKEEATSKRPVHGYVTWKESRDVVRVPVHNIFNVGKEFAVMLQESIPISLPPQSTSFCDLGFPGNVEKTETSLTENEDTFY